MPSSLGGMFADAVSPTQPMCNASDAHERDTPSAELSEAEAAPAGTGCACPPGHAGVVVRLEDTAVQDVCSTQLEPQPQEQQPAVATSSPPCSGNGASLLDMKSEPASRNDSAFPKGSMDAKDTGGQPLGMVAGPVSETRPVHLAPIVPTEQDVPPSPPATLPDATIEP